MKRKLEDKKLVFKNCVNCNKEITNRRRKQAKAIVKTCSLKCSYENNRKTRMKATRKWMKKKLRQCKLCQKWFRKRMGGSPYCLGCYSEGKKKERRIWSRKKYWETEELLCNPLQLKKIRGWRRGNSSHLEISCLQCGKKGLQKLGNKRYCSVICRRKVGYQKLKKLRDRNPKYANCSICQKTFHKINASVTCSPKCLLEKKRKTAREWLKRKRILEENG